MWQKQVDVSQELGSVGVPPLDGGRFRRVPDMALVSCIRWDSEGAGEAIALFEAPEM